jgi:hypothetical protein
MSEFPEIEAMKSIGEALEPLAPEERARVTTWIADKYGGKSVGPQRSFSPSPLPPAEAEEPSYDALGDLVQASGASNGTERALIVGYWLQSTSSPAGWTGSELNTAMKNLGFQLSNVTVTLKGLRSRKPSLVIQVSVTGRNQAARKLYKLSAAGVKLAQEMIEGEE